MKKSALLLLLLFTIGSLSFATFRPASRQQLYYCLSSDTKSTGVNIRIGDIAYETDTGRTYVYDGTAWVINLATVVTSPETLTYSASGDTHSISLDMDGFNEITYTMQVAALNASADSIIVVYVEGRSGTVGWINLDAGGDSTHITTSGNYGWRYEGTATIESTRVHISIATNATYQAVIDSKRGR